MRKIFYICFAVLLGGCASTMQSHLNDIQHDFANSEFKSVSDSKPSEQNNLDLLINGNALFLDGQYNQSDEIFEEFNKRGLHETSTSITRETAGLLFGQSVNSYKPYMMDSLFVSYYQIWDLLAMNDWANARVVINQSYERQKNMSIEYKKLIEQNKEKIQSNSQIKDFINKNKSDWVAFRDIMNPALMYLSGIYFLNDGDFDNAITYLKRANGMMPDNQYIIRDLQLAQQRIKPKNVTWTFFESGFAPRLTEKDAGLFLPKIGMIYFVFSDAYLNNQYTKPENGQILADVDAMFMTEYNEYQTNEILRSITSGVSKTALQTTMYNSGSDASTIMGIISSVYTVTSSHADVRTWATLPKYIYAIRTENKTNENNLVYIREIDGKIISNKTINLTKGATK